MKVESNGELTRNWAVEPGTFVLRVLDQRGLRQSDLAERTGLSAKHVNQIVKNKVPISGDVAVALERALSISATFWMRVAADHEAQKSSQRAQDNLVSFAAWARGFDRSTLVLHGIVAPSDSIETVAEKLLRFFGVATPDAFTETYLVPRVSFRRSQHFTVDEPNTALWLRLVELKAKPEIARDLNVTALKKTAQALPRLSTLPIADGFLAARDALAAAGVSLVFVPEIPRSRICAATWWFGSDRPVIGLTGRHKRVDTIWFNLMHEVGHILLHPKRSSFLDLDDEMKANDGAEREANAYAEQSLIPRRYDEQILAADSRLDLARLASEIGVGLSVVAGQYAHRVNSSRPDAYRFVAKDRLSITDKELEDLASV